MNLEESVLSDDYREHVIEFDGGASEHYIVHQVIDEDKEIFYPEKEHIVELRNDIFKTKENIFAVQNNNHLSEENIEELEKNLEKLQEELNYSFENGLEDVYDYDSAAAIQYESGEIEWFDEKTKELDLEM